jgi:hypothetical protein
LSFAGVPVNFSYRTCLCSLLITIALPEALHARTWIVREDGSGDMPTIQGGIVRAVTGDTVLVMPGTYHEDIDFLGKGVLLKSDSGPEVTILNGANEDSSIVIFKRGETSQAVLDGFTLTGGVGTPVGGGRDGGAVWCRGAPRRYATISLKAIMLLWEEHCFSECTPCLTEAAQRFMATYSFPIQQDSAEAQFALGA